MEQEQLSYFYAKNGLGKVACYSAKKERNILPFIRMHEAAIQNQVHENGGLILRNFSLRSLSEFNTFARTLTPELLDYTNRSTPRTKVGGKIYTATEYPAHKTILPHNENAYTLVWPEKIFFFCLIPAETGGETPIVDSRQVYNRIKPSIRDAFNDKQILYVRNYTPGLDLSWQEVFQTDDKQEVEQYCNTHKIAFTWHSQTNNNLELTTKQVCPASLRHPITHEHVWFNQAHLFHTSGLDEEEKQALIATVGENALPRNSYYGDGTELPENDLKHIRDIYDAEKITFPWERGDVMILDNRLMAHAREPFTGTRKVFVAMG